MVPRSLQPRHESPVCKAPNMGNPPASAAASAGSCHLAEMVSQRRSGRLWRRPSIQPEIVTIIGGDRRDGGSASILHNQNTPCWLSTFLIPRRHLTGMEGRLNRSFTEQLESRTLLSGAPDLVLSIREWVGPSGTCVPGDTYQIVAEVTNIGSAASIGTGFVGFALATPGASDPLEYLQYGIDVGSSVQQPFDLAPGASTIVTTIATVSMAEQSGRVVLSGPESSGPYEPTAVLVPVSNINDDTNFAESSAMMPSQYYYTQEFGNVAGRQKVRMSLALQAPSTSILASQRASVTFQLLGPGTGYVTDNGTEIILTGTTRRSVLLIGDHLLQEYSLSRPPLPVPAPPVRFTELVRPSPLGKVLLSHIVIEDVVTASSPAT